MTDKNIGDLRSSAARPALLLGFLAVIVGGVAAAISIVGDASTGAAKLVFLSVLGVGALVGFAIVGSIAWVFHQEERQAAYERSLKKTPSPD